MSEQPLAKSSGKKDVMAWLQSDSIKQQIALALPRHLKPDRMVRVALTAINTTPKLLNCTRESLWACMLKSSQYGLEPDGRHAHLIPYGTRCELIFDYKGLATLVRQSGEVRDIHCDVVMDLDEFEYSFGESGTLRHKPNLKVEDRGRVYCAYSFVRLKDGSPSYEVMTVKEINAIRDRSAGYKDKGGPWKTDWAEMAKKTVFRRHTKWLPLSMEIKEAIHADDDKLETEEDRFKKARPVGQAETGITVLSEPGPAKPATTDPVIEQLEKEVAAEDNVPM